MHFKIKTLELKKGLDIVNNAVSSISTTPILENILLRVNGDKIILISNNLETAIEYTVSENLEIYSNGAVCINSKIITKYINLLQDEEIELKLNKNIIEIKTESDYFKINGIEAEEFPLIPELKENNILNIDSIIFLKAIAKTLFSTAEGNIRPTLAGILCNFDENDIIFAATDTIRLTEYKIRQFNNNSFHGILPSKSAQELKSILSSYKKDSIKILFDDSAIVFNFGQTKFFSRLLNGQFPNYLVFFPKNWETKSELNKNDLIQGLKKINLLSKENDYSIKITFSSEYGVILETNESQTGEGEVKLHGNVQGKDNFIGINSILLLEALSVIDSDYISISFETNLSPILVTPVYDKDKEEVKEIFRHIIMPLKI